MQVIFIIGATISFFMAFLVLKKKERSIADYILVFVLALTSVYLSLLYINIYIDEYKLLFKAAFSIPLLFGPVIFLYVSVMVNGKNSFKPIYWLHGLPFLLFNLYFFLYLYFPGFAENGIILLINYELVDIFKIYFYLIGSSVYIILALIKLRTHKKNISNNFSYIEQIDLIWLKYVVIGFGVFWTIVLIIYIFEKFQVLAYSKLAYLIYLLLNLYMFFLAYFGLKQQAIYKIQQPDKNHTDKFIPSETVKKKRYKHSVLTQDEAKIYLKQLLEYFEKEKPYIDNKLTLKTLSAYLNISSNHLSQVINEQLKISFFDFVNKYRIKEAKSRICNPKYKNLTILAIAFDSGFNSKSSFNSVFKKFTGFTPSQYIKQKKYLSK